jgi:septum formation protein
VRVVLASASPARLAVLRAAGIDPLVAAADLDEEALLGAVPEASPAEKVTMLAAAKATTVARTAAAELPAAVVIGCDSMLHIDGELVGKPGLAEVAATRWRAMAGKRAELVTGHAVLRTADGGIDRVAEGHAVTGVRFGEPSEPELAAYVASGEPLAVAGGFTIDGLGGWFVEGIDGDHTNVIGISLPLTRKLLAAVGVRVTDLWERD